MLAPRISGAAIDTAHAMRAVMRLDMDEYDMADRVREMNEQLNRNGTLSEAWTVLDSAERSAWKALLILKRKEHEYRY